MQVAGSQRGRGPRATFGLSETLADCPGGPGGGSQALPRPGAAGPALQGLTTWRRPGDALAQRCVQRAGRFRGALQPGAAWRRSSAARPTAARRSDLAVRFGGPARRNGRLSGLAALSSGPAQRALQRTGAAEPSRRPGPVREALQPGAA